MSSVVRLSDGMVSSTGTCLAWTAVGLLVEPLRNRARNSVRYLFVMLKRRRIISNTNRMAATTNSTWASEVCLSIGTPAGEAICVGVGSCIPVVPAASIFSASALILNSAYSAG